MFWSLDNTTGHYETVSGQGNSIMWAAIIIMT